MKLNADYKFTVVRFPSRIIQYKSRARDKPENEVDWIGAEHFSEFWANDQPDMEPYRQLLKALLCRALKDALAVGDISIRCSQFEKRKTLEWFRGVSHGEDSFTWESVQTHLGIPPDVAKRVQQAVEAGDETILRPVIRHFNQD